MAKLKGYFYGQTKDKEFEFDLNPDYIVLRHWDGELNMTRIYLDQTAFAPPVILVPYTMDVLDSILRGGEARVGSLTPKNQLTRRSWLGNLLKRKK